VKEPVLGLYGEADAGIPTDQVKQMEAALKAAFHEYPGAPHGFVADYRPSYRKEAAEDAWNNMTPEKRGRQIWRPLKRIIAISILLHHR
jgi:carboxymethylenebutenolidase